MLEQPAQHCYRLLGQRRLSFLLRGPLAPALAALGLVALLAFGEFELAALLGIDSWTVRLFDAQAGGLPIGDALRLTLIPAAIQALGLGALLALLWRCRMTAPRQVAAARQSNWLARGYLAFALLLVTCLPLSIVLRGTLDGMRLLLDQFVIGKELAASCLLAGCSAGLAYLLACTLAEAERWWLAALLTIPGLLGSLLLSLCLLSLFQLPLLQTLQASPAPLILCLTLLLLPYALVLRLLTGSLRPTSALHLARMLPCRSAGRGLRWRLDLRPQFWVVVLLFCMAYFELTAAAILQSSMTPVTVRLYNQMHYGQSAGLSAMLCVSLALPGLLTALAYNTRRVWLRV